MNTLHRLKLLALGCGLTAALVAQTAGTGSLSGRVTDAASKLTLGSTHVTVSGTTIDAYADQTGSYTLLNVPAGVRTVTFSYVGYPELKKTVSVPAGSAATLNAVFGEEIVSLDRFVITGSKVGQARAINQQRAAETLSNIVAADEIGRFPDQNAAESAQRIPGVALYRDQGEGRFLVVRGIRPDLNGIQLNGVAVTSPDRGARTVPLDVIPSEALGAIEVTKVPRPDLDIDGLGGRVNLKTRSPFDAEGRQIQIGAEGQYNFLRDRLSNKFTATYSDIFRDGTVGVIFSPTWQARRFGSDNIEGSSVWVVPSGQTALLNPDINYREYEITRDRYGANAAVEFKPDAASLYFVRAVYSHFADRENRYVTTIPFSEYSAISALTASSATVTGVRRENKQLRSREKVQDLASVAVGGERTFGDWQVDARAAYSQGDEDRVEDSAIFRKSARGSAWSYSFDRGTYKPSVTQVGGTSISDPSVFNELNRLRSAPATGSEKETNLSANARDEFVLAGGNHGFVKFGGQARLKTKEQDREQTNYAAPASFTFASLAETQTADDYGYFTGPRISAEGFKKAFIENRSAFTATRDAVASQQEDWKTDEDVYALYGMGGVTLGEVSLSGGVRYERTEFDTSGYQVRTTSGANTLTAASRSRSYDNWLPGLYLRYEIDPKTVVRASWSSSVARPNFSESAFIRSVSDDTKTVSESNPGLKALESTNWDASVEHYFASLGTLSAAVFQKDITNFTYRTSRAGADPENPTYTLSTYVNGNKGHITGLELAYVKQFSFLPAPFDGLGLLANYTLCSSAATYLRTATSAMEDAPFIGQSRHLGNVALTYEKRGLFVRLAMNFRSARLREDEVIGDSAANDIYVDAFRQLDLSASYKFNTHWEIYGEVLNITDEPFRVAFGRDLTRFRQIERYGQTANFGVRVNF